MVNPILVDIESRPTASDAYLWCDYIELRCLAGADHRFSRGDLTEVLSETFELAPSINDAEQEDDLREEDAGVVQPHIDDEATEEALAELPEDDRFEARVASLFRSLSYRAQIFGDQYPFSLDADVQELSLREVNSDGKKLYVQLLLSSSLRLVPKPRRHELTDPFEQIATKIFCCLMPAGWEVHRFGAAAGAGRRYTGHLYDRLVRLAADIRGKLSLERGHFKTRNAGDGGLDIVAWHPMGGDSRNGIPIALAQCGCTAEEWSLKMLEASPAKLSPHLHTLHPWATYYFMPQDLVNGDHATQDWQRLPDIPACIVVDRLRLIKLAEQYGVLAECANASGPVDEAIELAAA